jgi:PAS domain-containing protein
VAWTIDPNIARNGDQIRVESRWSLQLDTGGKGVGVLQVDCDVRELKQFDESHHSEVDARMLVEYSPHGIFGADAQSRYLDGNPAGKKMLGYTKAEIL